MGGGAVPCGAPVRASSKEGDTGVLDICKADQERRCEQAPREISQARMAACDHDDGDGNDEDDNSTDNNGVASPPLTPLSQHGLRHVKSEHLEHAECHTMMS